MAENEGKWAKIREKWRKSKGPCGFCGVTLEKGTQIFAIYDFASGMLIFLAALVILMIGDWKSNNYYPHEKFSLPRQLVIFFVFAGFYNSATALLLYFSAGTRNMGGCYAWLILCFPFNFVSPVKIYQSAVVYALAMEIMAEDRARGFFFGQEDHKPKPHRRKVQVRSGIA